MSIKRIQIYTDGGCRGNPGIGGWGVYLKFGEYEKKLKGSQPLTTNNQMELTAVIKALASIKDKSLPIDLHTDSKYVMTGINEWIANWKQRGWKTAIKNQSRIKSSGSSLISFVNNLISNGTGLKAIVAISEMKWQMSWLILQWMKFHNKFHY